MKTRLPVERDSVMEEQEQICLNGASAYYDGDDGTIHILAEAESAGGAPIDAYREFQAVAYGPGGELLGRDFTNWSRFGRRQSFSLEFENLDPAVVPSRVKLFPTGSDE